FDGIKMGRCVCCNGQRTERVPKLCLSRSYPLVCFLHALCLLYYGIVRKVRCRRRRGGHDVERDGHSEQHASGSDTGHQDVAAKHQTCRNSGDPTERHGVDQERGDCRPSAGVSAFMRTRPEGDKLLLLAAQQVTACGQLSVQTTGMHEESLPFPKGVSVHVRLRQPSRYGACSHGIVFGLRTIRLAEGDRGSCRLDALLSRLNGLTMSLDLVACVAPLLGGARACVGESGWAECIRVGNGSLMMLPQRPYLRPLLPQRGEPTSPQPQTGSIGGWRCRRVAGEILDLALGFFEVGGACRFGFFGGTPRLLVLLERLFVLLHRITDGNGDIK